MAESADGSDAPRLSHAQVEKAREAIDFLSTLAPGPSGDRPSGSRAGTASGPTPVRKNVIDVAEKALQSLKRVRAGMTAEKKRGEKGRKRVRQQMSELFTSKKKALTSKSRPAWKHRFICLAYRDQARIPTTDAKKDELYEAGLGEKEISFDDLEMPSEEFRELLYEHFPTLKDGGGFSCASVCQTAVVFCPCQGVPCPLQAC